MTPTQCCHVSQRTFTRVFVERTVHAAGLCMIFTEAWYNDKARLVLVEMVPYERPTSAAEWRCGVMVRRYHAPVTESAAIRFAISAHDELVAQRFVQENAACEESDGGDNLREVKP